MDQSIFDSKGAAAKALNVDHSSINNHLDKWIKGGIKGNYLFSSSLDQIELDKLKDIYSIRKYNNLKVWFYDAKSLELISDVFSSMKKLAEYFNVDYRSLLKHLDTNIASLKGGKLVLLFSNELTEFKKKSLKEIIKQVTNETTPVWVYKNINNELILIDSRKPTFSSKHLATKNLKISTKTISKYLDSGKCYKRLYLYSVSRN